MDNSSSATTRIEGLLQDHYQAPAPDPAFLSNLRFELLAGKSELTSTHPRLSRKWAPRSWHYALAGALLLILAAVVMIGPERVWAQFESWIAYLPGWGKVELSGTRVLEEPVSYSKDGVTFEVQEFVASPKETYITIQITGIPESAYPSLESGMSGISDTVYIQWDGPDGQRKRLSAWMGMENGSFPPCLTEDCPNRHPDGLILKARGGPLPPEITQVRVEWLPYRIVPDTATSETWTLNILLNPISVEDTQDYFQLGYSPQSAEDFQHDIKITVDEVYLDATGTVIDASIVAPDPVSYTFAQGVYLSTDQGYRSGVYYFTTDLDMICRPIYKVTPDVPRATTIRLWPERWQFAPIDSSASRMTLEIESVIIRFDTRDWFEIEIDHDPEVGSTMPLDINIDYEGFPLHIYQARIIMAPAVFDDLEKEVKSIEFLAENSLTADGKRLNQLVFCPYDKKLIAEAYASGGFVECGQWLPLEPDLIKDGKIRVAIDMVEIEQQGPWVIRWDVP